MRQPKPKTIPQMENEMDKFFSRWRAVWTHEGEGRDSYGNIWKDAVSIRIPRRVIFTSSDILSMRKVIAARFGPVKRIIFKPKDTIIDTLEFGKDRIRKEIIFVLKECQPPIKEQE